MFAAAGTWLGPLNTVEAGIIAAIIGAALAMLWMVRSSGVRTAVETLGIAATLPSVLSKSPSVVHKGRSLPYGVAMAAGAICAGWMPGLLLR